MQILNVTQTIVNSLRNEIITRQLRPKYRLREPEIAKRFNVSRAPVREALKTLEEDRLIVNIPRKGCYVSEFSVRDFKELFEIRKMIETYSIEILKEKNIKTFPEMEELTLKKPELREIDGANNTSEKTNEFFETIHFHNAIIKATENSWMIQLYKKLLFHMAWYQYLSASKRGAIEKAQKEHKKIYSYLKEGKWDKAKNELIVHIGYWYTSSMDTFTEMNLIEI